MIVNPCSKEFQDKAKQLGLSGREYIKKLTREGKLKTTAKIDKERRDFLYRKQGYEEGVTQYNREYNWESGRCGPMFDNPDCATYLGIFIGERVSSKIFGAVKRMPPNHPGYDFICRKGFKIDVKSRRLDHHNGWPFNISHNNIADYFILIGFNKDINNLEPLHIWIFHRNDIVRGKKFWKRDGFFISNLPKKLIEFRNNEMTDKLDQFKECCNKL